jgi:hypothetical protein
LAVAEPTGRSEPDAESTGTGEEESWALPEFPKLDTSLGPRPKPEPPPLTADSPVTPATDPSGPDDGPTTPQPEPPVLEPYEPKTPEPPMPDADVTPTVAPDAVAPEPAPDSRPEDRSALSAAMKAARTATMEGKFDAAMNELKKVASVPKSPEHQAKYDRLSLLAQYADNFRSALRESLAALEAGDEIEVGANKTVGVVGTTANSITVRVSGVNRTYSVDTMPTGLAVAVADTWLRKEDSVSLAMKGAYVATRKDADAQQLDKARQWLQEASSKDRDMADLEKVLDDTYDF